MSNVISDFSLAASQIISGADSFVARVGENPGATGFVWDTDGHIVSASHSVRDENQAQIYLPEIGTMDATIIGRDSRFDIVLLKIDAVTKPAEMAEEEEISVGQIVFPLGRPGETIRATMGFLSVKGKAWTTPFGGDIAFYLETDGSLPRGFSGGPLLSPDGKIIGINSSIPRGRGMTVPAVTMRSSVKSLLEGGDIKRGYLGVNTISVPLPADVAEKLSKKSGLLVTEVEQDSPANRAGILQGDTIVSVGKEGVSRIRDLMRVLNTVTPLEGIPVEIVRAGSIEIINCMPDAR